MTDQPDRLIIKSVKKSSADNGRQAPNQPRGLQRNRWQEIGTPGLDSSFGFLSETFLAELQWPGVYPLYNRIRRMDPEITIIRQLFSALASRISLAWETPWEEPTDDDKRAAEFGNEGLEDLEGGIDSWIDAAVNYTPFLGWAFWEVVPGLRREGWRPPGDPDDPWRSRYDDGLLGIRRLAWRDHSSFKAWDIDDYTGRLYGMIQRDSPNQEVTIPIAKAVHLKFGDPVNPEGLAPLEAVYRLERLKYGLEVVQGIGFEHSAGYLDVQSEKDQISSTDKTRVKAAARAILSAQEGNYALWPKGFSGALKASSFDAATSILEAIRYYGILKLQVFNMQWVALSSTTGTGSFAAKKEDTTMFVLYFNAMMEKFAKQLGEQLAPWLFDRNAGAFPDLTRHPVLKIEPIQKMIDLTELTPFIQALAGAGFFEVGEEDVLWFRRQAGMPEAIPDADELAEGEETGDSTVTEEADEEDAEEAMDDEDVAGVMERFRGWAQDHAPAVASLLDRRLAAEIDDRE